MSRSQRWLVAMAVLLGAASLAYLWSATDRSSADAPADGGARESSGLAKNQGNTRWPALAALPADHPQRGWNGRYAVDVSLQMTTEVGAVRQAAEVRLQGELAVSPPADEALAKAGWLVGEVRALRATGDGQLIGQLGMQQPSATPRSFALRADATGDILERRFDPAMPVGERNLITALGAAVQVVRPVDDKLQPKPAAVVNNAAGQQWQATEAGASATQYANYQQRGDTTEKKWSRTRQDGATPVEADGATSAGSATLTWSAAGLAAAEIRQMVDVDLALHEAVRQHQQVTTKTTLQRLGAAPANVSAVQPGKLTDESPLAGSHAARTKTAATGRALTAILGSSAAASAKQDSFGRRSAAAELTANLEHNPQLLADLRKQLWTVGQAADAIRTQLEALAATPDGSGEAVIRALIADTQAPREARWHAMTLLLTLHKPEPSTLLALRQVADNDADPLAGPGALALAAQVHRGQADGSLPDTTLLQFLLTKAELTFAADRGEQARPELAGSGLTASNNPKVWLVALGNLGGEQVYSQVAPYLVDQREGMRKAAINSLRFVPTTMARIALLKALQKDPSPYARRAAAETALYHPQKYMEESVIRALQEDAHPEVQIGASWTLAVWAVTAPGLYAEIKAAADRATNPNLKQILGQMAVGSISEVQAQAEAAKAALQEAP